MSASNFTEKRFGDIAKVIPGYAFKSDDFGNEGYPVVKIAEINPPRINLTNCQRISADKVIGLDRFRLAQNDILIAMTGATLGKVGRLKEDVVAYVNQRVAKIDSIKGVSDKDFLYYLITGNANNSQIVELGLGSAQSNFSGGDLENLHFSVPDLPTQRHVAAILSSLDDKIEINREINATLESIVQAIYKEWFVEFRFPGATSGMHETLLGPIPKEWRIGSLEEMISNYDSKRVPLSSREREKRKGKYPYYGAASIVDYIDDYLFDGVYLLMGEDGTVITKDDKPVLQYVSGKFWANNHTHVLRGKGAFSTEFVYTLLMNANIKHLVTGAVQPKINQGNMNSLPVIIPEGETLNSFQEIISPIFANILAIGQQSANLGQLRDNLLPRLMSGEIEI